MIKRLNRICLCIFLLCVGCVQDEEWSNDATAMHDLAAFKKCYKILWKEEPLSNSWVPGPTDCQYTCIIDDQGKSLDLKFISTNWCELVKVPDGWMEKRISDAKSQGVDVDVSPFSDFTVSDETVGKLSEEMGVADISHLKAIGTYDVNESAFKPGIALVRVIYFPETNFVLSIFKRF